MFSKQWLGVEEGCFWEDRLMPIEEYENKMRAQKRSDSCNSNNYIKGVEAEWQSSFDGNTICGKLGVKSIADSPAADSEAGCPAGYTSCTSASLD